MSVPLWLFVVQVAAVATWPTLAIWCWRWRDRAKVYRELCIAWSTWWRTEGEQSARHLMTLRVLAVEEQRDDLTLREETTGT